MNEQENYKCEKCGHTLLKSNKFLHDLKCNTSQSINDDIYINNQNDFNDNDNFFLDTFKCEICNARMKYKDKADHLLCHELEQNEQNISNDNDRINSNININSNQPNIDFNINNSLLRPNYDIDRYRIFNRNNNGLFNRTRLNPISFGFNSRRNIRNPFDSGDDFGSLEDEFDEGEPLDNDIIQTYPISKIHDINKLSEDKKRCSICLENFKNGDDSIILPCIHIFHSECIKKWMKNNGICPICKLKINSNNNDNLY
jgi:hypothetical protein